MLLNLRNSIHSGATTGNFTKLYPNKPTTFSFDNTKWGDDGIAELCLLCYEEAKRFGNNKFQIDEILKFTQGINEFNKLFEYFIQTLTQNSGKKLECVCRQLEGQIPSSSKAKIAAIGSEYETVTIDQYINWKITELLNQYNRLDKSLHFHLRN